VKPADQTGDPPRVPDAEGAPPAAHVPPYLAGLKPSVTPEPSAVPEPRAPKRRPKEDAAAAEGPRPRSRPLKEPAPFTPVVLWRDLNPPLGSEKGPWRWTPVVAGLAGLAWLVAFGMLGATSGLDDRVSSPRATLAVAWLLASVLTFLPLEFRLGLPGLTWQGMIGWTLLGYTLAFVPPPTGWLLDLPDLPVYLVFFLALFYAVASSTLPLTFLAGRRLYQRRMHRHDLRRARRQAYEFGMLAVTLTALAGLRVLSLATGLLLVAIFVLAETLLLSQVAPEG